MDNKLLRGALIGGVAVIMLLGSFSGGFLVGPAVPTGKPANPDWHG